MSSLSFAPFRVPLLSLLTLFLCVATTCVIHADIVSSAPATITCEPSATVAIASDFPPPHLFTIDGDCVHSYPPPPTNCIPPLPYCGFTAISSVRIPATFIELNYALDPSSTTPQYIPLRIDCAAGTWRVRANTSKPPYKEAVCIRDTLIIPQH